MKSIKKVFQLFAVILLSLTSAVFAQAPQAISYQAIARNNTGNVLQNQNISLRFSIRNLTAGGTVVYRETHSTATNAYGSFTVNIGGGTVVLGTFNTVNWAIGNKFIEVEIDPAGGSSYISMGTQQMLSVPYAFVSSTSSSAWNLTGNSSTVDGTNFFGTSDNVPLTLKVNNQKAGRIDNTLSNTYFGYLTGNANTTGNDNVAIGQDALSLNTTGDELTAIGDGALLNSVGAGKATAVGYRSQYYANNTASAFNNWNTSIGNQSLRGSTTPANNIGTFNTALGSQTLLNNTSGSSNTASGFGALEANTTGNANTANGRDVLASNTSGQNNTGCGYTALFANTEGIRNCAYGDESLEDNTTGSENAAFGANSLSSTTVSNYNTAVGQSAGAIRNNGGFNTFIGHAAYANADGYTNSTALGDNTTMTASNQVRIGNGVGSIGGPQNWSNTSDARIKLNVNEDVPGLSFIKLLRPVTYNKSLKLEYEIIGKNDPVSLTEDNTYEQMRYTGFIAQEVEKAAKEIGYDFSGVDAPKNEKDLYALRYAEFVVPLVKAVQEQQSIIDDQKKVIAEIILQNEKLNLDNVTFKAEIEKIKSELGMDVRVQK